MLKILYRGIIGLTFLSLNLVSFSSTASPFAQADTLFQQHQYTQAFQKLDSLYQNRVFSESSLLKLAYISEADNRPQEALSYLLHYAQLTRNERVYEKIQTLADETGLEGYTLSDYDRFVLYVQEYKPTIIVFFGALLFFLLVSAILRFLLKKSISSVLAGTMIACTALFTWVYRYTPHLTYVTFSYATPVLSSPSAGSEAIANPKEGDRFVVIQTTEQWVEIELQDGSGFVRSNQVRPIH